MARVQITAEMVDNASDDVKRLNQNLGQTQTQLKGVEKQSKKTGRKTRSLGQDFKAVATKIAAVTAAAYALKKSFDFVKEGAQIQRLRKAGDLLAADFNQNMDSIIAAVQRGSNNTLSGMDAMAAANKALQLGVATTPEEFENLTRSAIALGRAMGRSASQSIDDVVTGIGRMSPLILDNIGITTEGGRVYERYAKSLGRTTNQLTDTEKKQALLNAATEAAIPLLDDSGELADDNAAIFERLGAAISDETATAMIDLADAMAPVAAFLADVLRANDDLGVSMNLLGEEIVFSNRQWTKFADGTVVATDVVRNQQQSLEASALRWQAQADAAGAAADAQNNATTATENAIEALEAFSTKTIGAPLVEQAVTDAMGDDFISIQDKLNIEAVADAFGVELPDSLNELITNFNKLKEEGIDNTNSSAETLADTLGIDIVDPIQALTSRENVIRLRLEVTGDSIPNLPDGGGGGGGGGSFVTDASATTQSQGGQHGLNFIVPPGYPNDSMSVGASSGERVIVEPAADRRSYTFNNNFAGGGSGSDVADQLKRVFRRL